MPLQIHMPSFRFEVPRQFRRPQMGPFTTTLVTVTVGILIAGFVALIIAFGVVILAVGGVAGLLITAWHQVRRRLSRPSSAAAERAHVEEVQEKHGYSIIQEAEVITLEEPPKDDR